MSPPEGWQLRPAREGDRDMLLRWRNSERIRAACLSEQVIPPAEHAAWFAAALAEPDETLMLLEAGGRPVGVVRVTRLDRANGTCTWGFYIGEEDAPAGSGAALGRLGLEHVFRKLGVRKVCGEVLARNEASQRFHRRLGFVEEGRLRRQVAKGGCHDDVVLYALFREDWEAARARAAGEPAAVVEAAGTFAIAGRRIGDGEPPYIVAELSGNHNGSLERALAIVDAAADAGAHAVKLQTYTADTLTIDVALPGFVIDDPHSPWHGRTLHELYREAALPWEWHEPIFRRCRERGLSCFSTPFDETAVAFLERLDAPAYKIASFECTHLPLVRRAAATRRPLLISTGMATAEEVDEAVAAARSAGAVAIALLKCTSTYPASPAETNLATLADMRARFGLPVGLSDHTLGIGVAVAGVALGAALVEKHLTLSRADGGVDAAFSLEPQELRLLVTEAARAWEGLGGVSYGPTERERPSLRFRRSLYAVRDVARGKEFTRENVRIIRPGFGLAPKHLDAVIGRRATRDVARGTPITWELAE